MPAICRYRSQTRSTASAGLIDFADMASATKASRGVCEAIRRCTCSVKMPRHAKYCNCVPDAKVLLRLSRLPGTGCWREEWTLQELTICQGLDMPGSLRCRFLEGSIQFLLKRLTAQAAHRHRLRSGGRQGILSAWLAVPASQELSIASMDLAGFKEVWHCLQSQPEPGSAVWPELLLGSSIRSYRACA